MRHGGSPAALLALVPATAMGGLCPFVENFEPYPPASQLHGQGGWKGWDDDPLSSAPVSAAHARSAPQSVEISGAADLVHEQCAGPGAWSYSAWQYIPSGFASGGGGEFDGSYFVLLNTYQDGGPYNWSVQIQIDGNDQQLKAFHGDGVDRIPIPYETDRWVKIQVIIDLEEDWTRIYYDDDLVTEYPWTGGVLGDGGGALDLAAVDLEGNGATSLHYDDLRLEPIPGCDGEPLLEDWDLDGANRLGEFLGGSDACIPDTDGDTVLDGEDNCPLEPNPGQADFDFDGIGDACDDEQACPMDLTGDTVVGVDDFLEVLAGWGTPAADINGDGTTGVDDFLAVLAAWGPCP